MKKVEVNADGSKVEYISVQAVETQVETFLLGKVLTIIDASYGNTQQGEAVKSLIKEKFHSQLDWLLGRGNTRVGDSEPEIDSTVVARHQYEATTGDVSLYVLPKEKLLSIVELENAWDHVGRVKSEYSDAYELLLPLGKDHTLKLIVDSEAIKDSGFFEEV